MVSSMPRTIVVVDPQFTRRLRAVRQDRGLSLRDLGRLMNYSHTYVWEIETGRKRPSPRFATDLDRALAADGELARLVSAEPVSAALDPDEAERLCGAAHHPRQRADAAVMDSLAVVLAEQRRMEDAIGSAQLVAPVVAQLAVVEDLMSEARGPLRQRALDIGAQWAQFGGWLHASIGNPSAGRRWYAMALESATEVGNHNMVATALSLRGHLAWLARQPGPLIGLSQAAGRQPASPGVRALAAQQEARGHALVGEAYEADRLLDAAAELAAQAAEHRDDEPPWVYFHSPDYLRMQRGLACRYLGRFPQAVDLLTAGLDAIPAEVRRSEWAGQYLYQLAVTHAQAGDHGAAAVALTEVEQIAAATGSVRLREPLRRLRERLDVLATG
jgi:transcriptional regulator with XRE-family HTH domain